MKQLSMTARNLRVSFDPQELPYAEVECVLVLIEKEYSPSGTNYKSDTVRWVADIKSLEDLQRSVKEWIDSARKLEKRLNKTEVQGELFR